MNIVTLGVHVVDILVRPVAALTEGQLTTLVEDIRITPADTAAGTAVILFSAGFLRAVGLGRSLPEATRPASATAALVARGLGTDHGSFDLTAVEGFARSTPTRTAQS